MLLLSSVSLCVLCLSVVCLSVCLLCVCLMQVGDESTARSECRTSGGECEWVTGEENESTTGENRRAGRRKGKIETKQQ